MAARRIGIIAFLICFCICLVPTSALVASSANEINQIDANQKCSLTLYYGYGETPFSAVNVKLYKVANVSSGYKYTPTSSFAPLYVTLNGIKSTSEWNALRSTLEMVIIAKNITPNFTLVTNEQGYACFENLETGLYFAVAETATLPDENCYFSSALVVLPGLDQNGNPQYHQTVKAKTEVLPPIDPDEKTELKVIKLWKDDSLEDIRPESVEIEIFHQNESYITVTLSAENNWSYSWTIDDDPANWSAIEKEVPSGYTMTVEKSGNSFVVTNTYSSDDPVKPPQTGDTANILLYVIIMILSGSGLIFLGLMGKRNRNEK